LGLGAAQDEGHHLTAATGTQPQHVIHTTTAHGQRRTHVERSLSRYPCAPCHSSTDLLPWDPTGSVGVSSLPTQQTPRPTEARSRHVHTKALRADASHGRVAPPACAATPGPACLLLHPHAALYSLLWRITHPLQSHINIGPPLPACAVTPVPACLPLPPCCPSCCSELLPPACQSEPGSHAQLRRWERGTEG
jgi:hypothetical protein